MLERRRVGGVGGHPGCELVDRDGGAESMTLPTKLVKSTLESSISITAQSSVDPPSPTSRPMRGDRTPLNCVLPAEEPSPPSICFTLVEGTGILEERCGAGASSGADSL